MKKLPDMSWRHVVATLIVTAGIFFTAWQAPLVLVIIIGLCFITKGMYNE
jgi:hypothetical protein